ncbi:hypothetical protein NQ176_g4013 [Zarea fungicola]|uniref:Uncharacterized protein n=1 Tax=Zarea fungicola TaxID=93591 RepID=A0ACC1NGB1_9HYPO|nr:hypothetical protein NQ176_g4013 [Lecanicillium fungicola]
MDSKEAKELRTLAELRYRILRKVESRNSLIVAGAALTSANPPGEEQWISHRPLQVDGIPILRDNFATLPIGHLISGVNIWQMRPESLWWDSRMCSLQPSSGCSSRDETRLLIMFLDVIHPITHTFYRLQNSADRSWMLERLVRTDALYSASLSISACFECSLTQKPSINQIGLSSTVQRLQNRTIGKLRADVDRFSVMKTVPVEDFVWAAVQLLDVIAHLETLEIFSMLQGQWEMHHQAARRILNHVETAALALKEGKSASVIEAMLASLPVHDTRRRSLEFCLINFVWIDVLATSTFGAMSYSPCAFNYIPVLEAGMIKPHTIMGCYGNVLAIVSRIASLEQWMLMQQVQLYRVDIQEELSRRRNQLDVELDDVIRILEQDTGNRLNAAGCLESDASLISLLWANGAKVLLQVTTNPILPSQVSIDQASVDICLEKLEALPTRLVMRASWPYTVAGSMAASESQQQRYRGIVGRTLLDAQPPGISWKGLIIMEECWRLRRLHANQFFGWREAMDSLGARVILT